MKTFNRLSSDSSGSAAVEFAIIAPVLAAAVVGMIDVGQLFFERSKVNNALRLAAQTAMSDPGPEKIIDVLNTFNERSGFSDSLKFQYKAIRYCGCSDQHDHFTAVACKARCPSEDMPNIFYRISCGTNINGILLNRFEIAQSIEVQVG